MTLSAMVILAVVCFVFRIVFVVLVPPERLPPRVHRALGHLPPVVLAALVAVETEELTAGSTYLVSTYLLATVLAVGLVAFRTRSLTRAIAVSAGACLLLDLVIL